MTIGSTTYPPRQGFEIVDELALLLRCVGVGILTGDELDLLATCATGDIRLTALAESRRRRGMKRSGQEVQ